MALTPSTMLPLGTPLPPFRLPDPSGKLVSSDDFAGAPALLVMILCNHCPYVKHVADGIARFARDYAAKGLAMVAINANDASKYPDDAPAKMAEEAKRRGYGFPYLYDDGQAVAKAFRAACTPEFYLFDREGRLAYRGRFDGSTPGNSVPVTGAELRAAADAVLAGRPAPADQKPSVGCNVKWKPGNEPDYF
jgi:peroxiredoxin